MPVFVEIRGRFVLCLGLVHLRIANDCLLHVTVYLPSVHLPQNIVADYPYEKSVAFVLRPDSTQQSSGTGHIAIGGSRPRL